MTPNRVNRARWPTKENMQVFDIFVFFRPMQKMPCSGTKWDQEDFFLLIQTLPTFWATWILILRIVIFLFCLDPKFSDFQVPNLQISRRRRRRRRRRTNSQPAPAPDELSDPNLTPLPTHPGIKYIARALAAIFASVHELKCHCQVKLK